MSLRTRHGWEIPESRITPEAIFLDRRNLILAGAAFVAATVAGDFILNHRNAPPLADDPSRRFYPALRNEAYASPPRALTPEAISTTTNKFYEFGAGRNIAAAASALPIRPWTMAIDGLVDTPLTFGIDDLLARVSLEERIYRHRCVEGWSMVVPWTGFPLKALLALARPLASAKYVRFEAFSDPSIASGQRQSWYPWPYVEALTVAEAAHELAFLVTGAYGKPLARSMGAPIRLHVPWKYGFKSVKSIVRVSFVEQRPRTFWPQLDPAA
ncbi:MAG TPA: protein-methionine-sulfoxide reductase catalytic subunit MsrP, partial [Bauldia sp.]|nr:protein-methionine-sulfoxide reductase catalytic subunit MsrP [Bauldia sp.]